MPAHRTTMCMHSHAIARSFTNIYTQLQIRLQIREGYPYNILIFDDNMFWVYVLEAPRRSASNECHNIMFLSKI